ncbi:MAG: hypothetical protein ACTHN5_01605 [Phycisphaerae bacterium]
MSAATLRDLLYLDWERIRGLAAQLDGGTLLSGKSGDLSILTQPEADRDHRFYKHQHETRSLHTAVFNTVEKALRDKNAITDITDSYDYAGWSPGLFHDGQLVLTTGLVRLLDYPWLASVMETMPRMLKVTQRAELSALKQQREQHKLTQQELDAKVKEHQAQLKDLEQWKMEELTEVVRELYGQTVRIKIVPAGSQRGEMFVGSCHPHGFTESAAVLSQKYGCDVDAKWQILGLMNVAGETNTPPMPTGNAVEDMFERLALAVNRIHRVASAPIFPAMSITPLAIYREL